jgi:hypothetical protein
LRLTLLRSSTTGKRINTDEDRSGKAFNMETQRKTYFSTDRREQYKRRAFEADLLKLTIAVVAELIIFFIWFNGPPRERYEIIAHVVLAVCIVLPIINYRYLIVVPFIAFLPDLARALGIDISHSLVILPLVFVAAFLPFIRRPRTALIAGYAACAIYASHLIIDMRKYATIENVGWYPWSDMILYVLILTVLGFLLVQVLRFGDDRFKGDSYRPGDSSLNNRTPLSSESATAVHRLEDNVSSVLSKPRRSRRKEVTAPEGTSEKSGVVKARDPFSSTGDQLQFDSDGFVVGDVTSKKAFKSKIKGKKGL